MNTSTTFEDADQAVARQRAARNPAIDALRGALIVLVVLGHTTGLPPNVHKFIYSFHMPAFFLLSGYLFNPDRSRSPAYIPEKFWRMVVPAWVMGAICGLPFIGLMTIGKISGGDFLTRLAGTAVGYPGIDQTFLTTPLWFLFALFLVELMATAAARIGRAFLPVVISVGVVSAAVSTSVEYYVPFNLRAALTALLFFGLGGLVKQRGLAIRGGVVAALTALAFVGWFTLTWRTPAEIDMAQNFLGENAVEIALTILASLLGTACVYVIATVLAGSRALQWLGVHTLPIVGFNYMANLVAGKALSLAHLNAWPLVFLTQLAGLIALCWGLDRTGLLGRVINGRYAPAPRRRAAPDGRLEVRPPS